VSERLAREPGPERGKLVLDSRLRAGLPVPERRARDVRGRAGPEGRPDHPAVRRAGLGRV